MQKTCNKCQIEKPANKFYKNAKNKDSLDHRCIECLQESRRGPNGETQYQMERKIEVDDCRWKQDLMKIWYKANSK